MELKAGKISHLHHDVIWLLRPKSFRILLSRVIYTSPELPNLNMKGKTKRILVVVVKWRFRARVLYSTKVWRHKNEISEIMGFVRIFWKNNVQEAYLPKMSISGQIVSEIFSYDFGCRKKALSDFLASSLSWKIANTGKPAET